MKNIPYVSKNVHICKKNSKIFGWGNSALLRFEIAQNNELGQIQVTVLIKKALVEISH